MISVLSWHVGFDGRFAVIRRHYEQAFCIISDVEIITVQICTANGVDSFHAVFYRKTSTHVYICSAAALRYYLP